MLIYIPKIVNFVPFLPLIGNMKYQYTAKPFNNVPKSEHKYLFFNNDSLAGFFNLFLFFMWQQK